MIPSFLAASYIAKAHPAVFERAARKTTIGLESSDEVCYFTIGH